MISTKPITIIAIAVSLVASLSEFASAGPYAPAAGQANSTAISKDDSRFVEWATGIAVNRGYVEIDKPGLGLATFGDPSSALGPPKGTTTDVVSLGDGGSATLSFAQPITNGPGGDFAVFENGVTDNFLELAFVEVSSNGVNFFRFPSVSLTQTATQVTSFGSIDPTNINDLAGKYRLNYGTPFDLNELAGVSPLLDVNDVSYVRVIDVVGDIQDPYATFDSLGNRINDPWPTPFATSGFDLAGVGVIHAVPEPGSAALAIVAAIGGGLSCLRRRRFAAKAKNELKTV